MKVRRLQTDHPRLGVKGLGDVGRYSDRKFASGSTPNSKKLRLALQIRKLDFNELSDLRVRISVDRLGSQIAQDLCPSKDLACSPAQFKIALTQGNRGSQKRLVLNPLGRNSRTMPVV
jgi:hypothetical protein